MPHLSLFKKKNVDQSLYLGPHWLLMGSVLFSLTHVPCLLAYFEILCSTHDSDHFIPSLLFPPTCGIALIGFTWFCVWAPFFFVHPCFICSSALVYLNLSFPPHSLTVCLFSSCVSCNPVPWSSYVLCAPALFSVASGLSSVLYYSLVFPWTFCCLHFALIFFCASMSPFLQTMTVCMYNTVYSYTVHVSQ